MQYFENDFLDIEKELGLEIFKLFTNTDFHNIPNIDRGFVSVKGLLKGGILFVGLNPSFTEESAINDKNTFYHLSQTGNYKYFRKFEEIATETDMHWSHMDMLLYRETKQDEVLKLISTKDGLDFVWKQLQFAKQILERSEPALIVVNNSLARTFMGKDRLDDGSNEWLGYQFKFDEELGTDVIQDEDSKLKGIPVFFTSMLTGQRALDNGSFERLKWHVRFTIDKKK